MADRTIQLTDGEQVNIEHIEALSQTTLIVNLSLGKWGNSKKVDSTNPNIQTDANRDMMKFSKKLIVSPEFEAINQFDAKFRKEVKALSLKTQLGAGQYVVPVAAFEQVLKLIRDKTEERQGLVDKFLAVYEGQVSSSEGLLASLHDSTDYDQVDEVASQFYVRHRSSSFSAPNSLKQLRNGIFEAEKIHVQRQMAELVEENRVLLRLGIRDVLNKVIDALTVKPDGKKRGIRDAQYSNLIKAVEGFSMLNIAGDAEMSAVIEKIKEVTGVIPDVDMLRSSAVFANGVRSQFDRIKSGLDDLIVEDTGTKRKITLMED